MDRREFARTAVARLEAVRPDESFVLDDEKFVIVHTRADGKSGVVSLTNYYDEYLHAPPATRAGVFERMQRMAQLIDSEEGLDEIRVLLMPRIRPRRYFAVDAQKLGEGLGAEATKIKVYYTPFAEHLGIGLAIDRPEHIEYIGDVEKYELPGPELDAIALTNLRRTTKTGLEEVRPGILLGNWGDEYAAERMLLPELWDALALDGDPVVFLPGAERIYVVGSNDDASLGAAMYLVEERLKRPRGMLGFAFVRSGGAWRFFEPRTPLGKELGDRLALHLADAYTQQKTELDAKFEVDPEGAAYVPSVMGIAEGGQLKATITTWCDGVRAFLPRAHLVGIGRLEEAGKTAMVPWQDVEELAGKLLVPVADLYPPRWVVDSFPDDETLARLRARATEPAGSKSGSGSGSGGTIGAPRRSVGVWIAIGVVVVVIVVFALTR